MNLTETQKTAATATGRNMIVSAGAGTGKTSVLVERFIHLAVEEKIPVTEILTLTYTEKAANEMKKRIMARFAKLGREKDRRDLESAYISTIHAFAARLLREHPFEAGVDPDFRVIESEESDFLKDQAMDEAFEKRCEKGNGVFEFLKIYSEDDIRAGILKVYDAARHDAKTLTDFFALKIAVKPPADVTALFEKMKEPERAEQFKAFYKNSNWTWQTVADYAEWLSGFSKKRSGSWPSIKEACGDLLAYRLDFLIRSWQEKFESLAISFEEIYEARKKERGFLDFDDLQIRALRLLKNPSPVSAKLLERCRKKFRQIMVDEFQDTNPLQLELIQLLSSGQNLFFVGDYKQSIYSFRGAEPGLFLNKEQEYSKPENGLRVALMDNFRTAAPVLDFINSFFAELWQGEAVAFEGLLPKAEIAGAPEVELIQINKKEEESMDLARMREADRIADRMVELNAGGAGIPYGSMAVLFQVMTDIGIYEQALKKRGIPYYSVAGTGFYHQPEIRDMVSFLSFLENPLADIPLAAALRSPLFQVRDNTLYRLSHLAKKDDKRDQATPLYEGVKKFETAEDIAEDEKEKIRFFLKISGELLAVKDRLKLTELLDAILEKTSYELTVLADSQGVRRYANLKKMVNLAREFETVEPLALGAFLRTLRRLETHEVRESEAQVEARESGRVVQLISVHRAKGLEFRAVFTADLAREKRSDRSGWIKAVAGKGYAMQAWNPEDAEWYDPASWQVLDAEIKEKQQKEWKRLFYVAATRAKERLIFSGVHKEKKKEKDDFSEMSSWMDWVQAMPDSVMQKVLRHPEEPAGFQSRKRAIAEKKIFEDVFGDWNPKEMEPLAGGDTILAGLERKPRLPARVIDLPVSAYAAFEKSPEQYRDVYEIGYSDGLDPERNEPSEPGDSYADFGTAVHRVLELLDFEDPEHNLSELIREACAGMLPGKQEEALGIVRQFCASPLFETLKNAKEVYRELPFIINQRHGRIEGVIDVLFKDTAGQWHVLDYKTAVGDAAKSKASGYELQIGMYAFAAHKILNVTPASGIIYFLKNQFSHALSFDASALKALGVRLAGMQDSIINFGNKMI